MGEERAGTASPGLTSTWPARHYRRRELDLGGEVEEQVRAGHDGQGRLLLGLVSAVYTPG